MSVRPISMRSVPMSSAVSLPAVTMAPSSPLPVKPMDHQPVGTGDVSLPSHSQLYSRRASERGFEESDANKATPL